MDLLSMLADGGFVALGVIIGRYVKHRGSGHDAPTHSLCSCGHGYGSHLDGKECGAEIRRPVPIYGYEWVPCPCRTYDGPEPLPHFMDRGLLTVPHG